MIPDNKHSHRCAIQWHLRDLARDKGKRNGAADERPLCDCGTDPDGVPVLSGARSAILELVRHY